MGCDGIKPDPLTIRMDAGKKKQNFPTKKDCRLCGSPMSNYGIELPQLHLCLCRDCSAIYKSMRDVNKEPFKEGMKQALLGINLEDKAEEYELQLFHILIRTHNG